MRFAIGQVVRAVACALVVVVVAGCPQPAQPTAETGGGATEHKHDGEEGHAEPTTLGESAELLEHLSEDIAAAFEKDDADAAHGPLHEVAHALEAAQLMLAKTEMSDVEKGEAASSIKKLGELFGKVDAKLHGDEGVDYSEVADEIKASLAAFCKAVGAEDHEHGDEGTDAGKDGDEAKEAEAESGDEAKDAPTAE